MNRLPTSLPASNPRPALTALFLVLAASAGAVGPTGNPPASLTAGGAAGPAPTAPALPAAPSAPAPARPPAPAPLPAALPAPVAAATPAPDPAAPPAPLVKPKPVHVREADGLLTLGANLTERGNYSTAEIAFWQVLHNPDLTIPDEKTALLGLAHLYRKEGSVPGGDAIFVTKAVAIYERFLKDYPDDERVPDAMLDLGRTQREMGAYKMAIGRFYSVINSTLRFPSQGFEHYQSLAKTAQFEIAETYFESGDYGEAARFYSKVRLLDLSPADRAHAHFMTAFSLLQAGDFENAVTNLHSFIEAYPDDLHIPEARYYLATSLRQLHRTEEALIATLDLLREEHQHDQDDPRRWSYWQRRTGNQIANEFFQNGDTFNALAIYKGLNELSADPSWRLPVTYQIALCYERLHQMPEARAAYNQIVAAGKPAAGAKAPSADLAQLADMASWRLAHLDWRDNINRQFNLFFTNLPEDSAKQGSAPAPEAPAPAPAPAPSPAPSTSASSSPPPPS